MARTEPSRLTKDELRELAEQTVEPAISIFFPTVRTNVEPEENSLHLKSLLGDVEDSIKAWDLRPKQIDELLKPLQGVLDNGDFWKHQLDGAAFFRTPELFRFYRLPYQVPEKALVQPRLKLAPLFQRLPGDDEWYVLCFSKGDVRFLKCTMHQVERVDLSGIRMPTSLEEALRYDDLQDPEDLHHVMTGPGARPAPGGKGDRDRAFHGHGTDAEDEKNQTWRYARQVDEALVQILNKVNAPLILASVEYVAAIYREASHYGHILEEIVEGNPDGLRDDEILEQSRAIMERRAQQRLSDLFERFGTANAHGRAGSDLEDILIAGEEGRIDTFFVVPDIEHWGRWDPTGGGLTEHSEYQKGDVDLCDLAVQMTLLHRGDVLTLPPEEMPVEGAIAALYRW